MAATEKAPVNPELLKWARERAGLSLDEAATRAKLNKDRRGTTPAERLRSFEAGDELPSIAQAENIAHAYHRPLVTFFLPAPPQESAPFADFRMVGDSEFRNPSPEFAALQLRIAAMHDTLREIATAEQRPSLPFVGSLSLTTGIPGALAALQKLCNADGQVLLEKKNERDAFFYLRGEAQKRGVYVVLAGNLGSHHTNISPEEFRGIAVADPQVPLVIVNPNDANTAQLFTLAHELVHILLGNKGISNLEDHFRNGRARPEEIFCNRVAGEFLVPNPLLLEKWEETADQETLPALQKVSNDFHVSRFVVLRRLYDMGMLHREEYRSLWAQIESGFGNPRSSRERGRRGPSRNILDHYRLGTKLLESVIGAAEEGIITFSEAAMTLRVPPVRFEKVRFPRQIIPMTPSEEARRP